MQVKDTRILGISGSLRKNSRTYAAVELALRGAAEAGAQTAILDLRAGAIPIYDEALELKDYPEFVRTLIEEVRASDGLILGTPVYHGTISGVLKNALDFLEFLAHDDPPWLQDRVAGLISVSGGSQGMNAINSMEFTLRALRAWTVPQVAVIPSSAFAESSVQEKRYKERLLHLGRRVAQASALFRVLRQNH